MIEKYNLVFGNLITTIGPFLKTFDPSLLQNITLWVLAIFIPFAIVFLTNLLSKNNQEERWVFEKMVLNDEVFQTKKIFWWTIFSIFFFSFFSWVKVSNEMKILALLFSILIILFFWNSFRKILRFSEWYNSEFEILFLKKLKISNSRKIIQAWKGFWTEKKYREDCYLDIFVSHIEKAIKKWNMNLAISLCNTFVENIDKREPYELANKILPKVLKWSLIFKKWHSKWLAKHWRNKKIRKIISNKHFPTLYRLIIWKNDYWNSNYMLYDFFKRIVSLCIKDNMSYYVLFEEIKNHSEIKEVTENKVYKRNFYYAFFDSFFTEVNNFESSYDIWEYTFPEEWKITVSNKGKSIPYYTLNNFIRWSQNIIFKEQYQENLGEIINWIFPNINGELFTSFLMLYFSGNIEMALSKNINFYIWWVSVSWSWSINETEESKRTRREKLFKEKEEAETRETVEVIKNYFHRWKEIDLYNEDLTIEQKNTWENLNNEEREKIKDDNTQKKLLILKSKLKGKEIKDFCKDDNKELNRNSFIKLIDILLK